MHIPVATYRLQLAPSFRFRDARALIPYLSQLGISDLYASPILKATRGSTHGYDMTDPDELNPELGTQEDFEALAAEVQAHRMGWLQDIVPNHMAYSSENRMLMDVFENGPRSAFYEYFDVFRDHPEPELRNRILAPFLASPLEEVLRRGDMRLVLDDRGLAARYLAWRFPLLLKSYGAVLWRDQAHLGSSPAGAGSPWRAFVALRDRFARLSEMDDSARKHRQVAEAKETLARLYHEHPTIHLHIDGVLESFHRHAEGAVEHSPLYRLLEQQVFKPVFWQVAFEKINYRRFFYLSDFIALRIEEPQVFQRVHRKIVELTKAGVFTGLRIDHVDGLYDPRAYLGRLRDALPDCYLVVEKILELDESLPTGWPIQGTSGYKFCNHVNGLFCKGENGEALTRIYHDFIGAAPDYTQLLYDEKRKILQERMAGEVAYLAHVAMEALRQDGLLTPESVQQALTALMAAFPVYRTYVDAHYFTDRDRAFLTEAVAEAGSRCPDCREGIGQIARLLRSDPQEGSLGSRQARQHFLMRFQQFTGPAMAKGFEDTLLYVYNRFISLNEVGGDPHELGLSLDQFHRFNQARARHWPHAVNATSTHDSKRGEDVRARLNVLSEIPARWRQAVARWAGMNERHKQRHNGISIPDRNEEYLLYQTLVGALPFDERRYDSFTQRIREYMTKAVREAKIHSNWVQPDVQYEGACLQFVDSILSRSAENRFWADFLPFQREVSEYGIYNSLSQTTLKMTCPGLPDFYQGAELWHLNLVDPDNRRPVDFGRRAQFLKELRATRVSARSRLLRTLMHSRQDGRIKLFLVHRGLRARQEHRDVFEMGDYVPASVQGSRAQHVVAFFRVRQNRHALAVVPRFLTSLVRPGAFPTGRQVWEDTRIALPSKAPGQWRDAITGKTCSARGEMFVGDTLSDFPVSILLSGPMSVGA